MEHSQNIQVLSPEPWAYSADLLGARLPTCSEPEIFFSFLGTEISWGEDGFGDQRRARKLE